LVRQLDRRDRLDARPDPVLHHGTIHALTISLCPRLASDDAGGDAAPS
jgi:hypothetical protein